MTIFIFLGPAGSGKGTQAQYIKENYNFLHLSNGDLLREEVSLDTEIGQKVKQVMSTGNLVTDQIIIDIIENRLSSMKSIACSGIIFDGFPRTKEQAVALDKLLLSLDLNLSQVVLFDLSLELSIERISGRLIDPRNNNVYHATSNPAPEDIAPFLISRDDDHPDKVKYRYELYCEQTQPLIEYYSDRIFKIDSQLSIDRVHSTIDELVLEHSLQT